jgi:exosortase D (VPLPA-CTERM-specific)
MVAMVGFNGLKDLVGPIGYLLFMIPLPDLFQYNLSSQLQLLSSAIGVQVIRLLNISVFLEGNIIDLGKYQLQVVDACSGLRYLFPLMSFGFLFASLYHTSNWQRWLLFLSTTPITILMNSLRIALAGILVNYGGTSLAEGFLHDFEGWVIFVGCIGLLLFETYILHKLNRSPGSVFDQFYVKWPDLAVWLEKLKEAKSWYSLITFNLLLLLAMPLTIMLQERAEKLPLRSQLANFPLEHKNWTGKERRMDPNIINSLKLSDFLATDFVYDDSSAPVNFYIAYYKSQRKGAAVHSPKSCLPAGGWRIMNSQQILIKAVTTNDGRTFQCNRALVNKGDQRILMYYWFQQRGRTITNEYMVKWYLFWDALNHNRTDGALIRLSVSLDEKMDEIDADKYLKHFLHDFYPLLNRYLPT